MAPLAAACEPSLDEFVLLCLLWEKEGGGSLESVLMESQSLFEVNSSTTRKMDELRASEYGYLDRQNHVYLDYTGAGLAATRQYQEQRDRLASTLSGNPHSINPTSAAATELVEATRARILRFLNAPPDEYAAIFTPNATGAARLVGESYPFDARRRLVLTADNHNSIVGLREFARRSGTCTRYVPLTWPELRVDDAALSKALDHSRLRSALSTPRTKTNPNKAGQSGLFAYPAQSNFSGVRHPLRWIVNAQERGYDVLLDAAAYLPTAALDLCVVKPDFVIMSWYKIFGFPTGIGCLVAKRTTLARLRRPWFSGGTVQAASVGAKWHEMTSDESAFEDGTLNFLSIPDVHFGIDWITKEVGLPRIRAHVHCLTEYFLNRAARLHHSDGRPMMVFYGPRNMRDRGGTVTFNILDASGQIVDERIVAITSSAARISLRTGCFCNPGAGEAAFQLDTKSLRRILSARRVLPDDFVRLAGLSSLGAVRVSFGLASNGRDVDRFFDFVLETFRDRVTPTTGLQRRNRC